MLTKIAAASLCLYSTAAAATIVREPGAFLYDSQYTAGPDSRRISSPGYWINAISNFNNQATSSAKILRLYPYAGDIEMYCTTPKNCVYSGPKQNVFVYYNTPSDGSTAVAKYRSAFPDAHIFAIIDGDTNSTLLKPLAYAAVGKATAQLVMNQICSDPNVDGVLFDLEPFSEKSAGQMALYQNTSINFSSSKCIDANHPNGRSFGVFLNPNKISDWSSVASALGTNGFLVVPGYDLGNTTNPPAPISIDTYKSSLTHMLSNMDMKSSQYGIAYTVGIPAAASFSEFAQFGYYDAANPPTYFRLVTDYEPAITQLGYIQSAISVITNTCKSPFFYGPDYWGWSQYKSPNPAAGQLLQPNIPGGDVVKYLANIY